MKYIDADHLKAEIDRIEEEARKVRVSGTDKEAIGADSKVKLCLKLKSIINSLQQEQPEVDLEMFDKRVTEVWGRFAAEPNDTIACLHIDSFIEIARYFFNLGINARK